MFKYNNERHGSSYIEFQYCEKKKRLFKKEKYFRDDSLYIDVFHKFDEFYKIYNSYFDDYCLYPISEIETNYYNETSTRLILESLKKDKPKYSERLIEWLEKCIKEYNGFYIIGV